MVEWLNARILLARNQIGTPLPSRASVEESFDVAAEPNRPDDLFKSRMRMYVKRGGRDCLSQLLTSSSPMSIRSPMRKRPGTAGCRTGKLEDGISALLENNLDAIQRHSVPVFAMDPAIPPAKRCPLPIECPLHMKRSLPTCGMRLLGWQQLRAEARLRRARSL